MSPEQRRMMIIATTLPLVAEYGTAVTTAQIARAAGIGEATIFRVFADKDELVDACMAAALRPDHVVGEIASIPLDQPLADRLTEAADALQAHLSRIGALAGALYASGHRRRGGEGPERRQPDPGARERSMEAVRDAVAELLEPEAASLRLPAAQVAAVFLGLLYTRPRTGGPDEPSAAELVDVFLHGALKHGALKEDPA
jgi:AcrR family transcriptional regulator